MGLNYTFHGQRPDEEVIMVWQRHPWCYLKSILFLVSIFFIPWIVYLFSMFTELFTITFSIVGTIGILWIVLLRYLWKNNVVILTNERVIVVDLKNPISRKVIEVPLKNIQNITFENQGFLQTLIGFGRVILQTAGAGANEIVLKNLNAPYDVQQLISKTMKN